MKRLVTFALAAAMFASTGAIAQAHHRHYHHATLDANGNYAIVRTASGLTARVIASAKNKFQGFINAVEAEGYRIRDIGCLSSGHMHNSKHHWGGACDINQRSRNITSSFMYHVTAIAHRFGLTDGCEWHYRDCGHIEVPTQVARHHYTHEYAARRHYRRAVYRSEPARRSFQPI